MRRLIALLYQLRFGLRIQAGALAVADLERERDELTLARQAIDQALAHNAQRLDTAREIHRAACDRRLAREAGR